MSAGEKAKHILLELKGHSPFTAFGAVLGILFMLVFRNVGGTGSQILFDVFHPAHVVLSAMVTASMFRLHAFRKRFLLVLVVGYFGSVGIATLSDIVIPHVGGRLFGLDIPSEAAAHSAENVADAGQAEKTFELAAHEDGTAEHGIHLGFIEEWYIVNPAAIFGVLIAYFLPRTKFPHAGHVLISTWASSSYLLMRLQSDITATAVAEIFLVLFIATWLPCCISDIVFPLLFVKPDVQMAGPRPVHARHSHAHTHAVTED